jgi:hypothetical protein
VPGVRRNLLSWCAVVSCLLGVGLVLRVGNASAPKGAAVVPFELLPSNHMLVQVTINGKGPYQFIFDLGAPITLVNNRAAEESGAIKANAPRSFLFGARGEAQAEDFQLGDLKANKVPLIVMDHPAIKVLSQVFKRRIDGIVGYTFFAHYKMTIDYQALTMTFVPVQFEVRNLMQDLPDRLLGPRVARQRILAPAGVWGLKVGERPADPSAVGVPVLTVLANSPAAQAGLKVQDILVSIDGRWTSSVADTYAAAGAVPAGQAVPVVIQRGDREITLLVQPTEGL